MYRKILFNKNLSLRERLKRFIAYACKRRGARINFNRFFRKVFKLHPDYNKCDDNSIENEHKLYWSFFNNRMNFKTLRVCKSISGVSNSKLIPEEIYVADIEPTLNKTHECDFLSYKSFYNRWFPGKIFPCDFFHNVDGEWLDHDLNRISFSEVCSIARTLEYPVVLKPNRDSYGGKGVSFLQNAESLIKYAKSKKNFVVQEKIKQHPFFAQYHENSLNTFRIHVYRSVTDNKMHVTNIIFRTGLGDNSLDNVSGGGVMILVKQDGYMAGYALDNYGKKFFKHPDSGLEFNKKIPDLEGLKRISLSVAHKIFYARVIGLDLCYDAESNWRMIEINILDNTIRLAQYYGELFFGEFSDEVYDYCKVNHWALTS